MKRLKGLRNIVVLLVIMGLILSGCTTGGSKQTETADTAVKPVKVGYLTFMSGTLAALGKGVDISVRMALEDFNKDAKVKIELQAEDAGSTPVTAKNGLDKLLESNPTSMILLTASNQWAGIVSTLDGKKIPTVTFTALPTIFEQGREWVFGVNSTTPLQVTAGLKYLHEKLGKSKIGVIVVNDDLGKASLAALVKESSVNNYTVIPEFFQPGDNDFTPSITKVRRQTPDAYVMYGHPSDLAKLTRQMKQLGIQEPIFHNYATASSFLTLMEANEVEGLYGIGDPLPENSTDSKAQDFAKRYKEKAGFAADQLYMAAYDGAMILFAAASKAGGDQKKILENLRANQGTKGIGGAVFSFDSKGRGRNDTNVMQVGPNKTVKILENVTLKDY